MKENFRVTNSEYSRWRIIKITRKTEERLTILIREILREEFEKQQKNSPSLISGNLEITMKNKSIKTENE